VKPAAVLIALVAALAAGCGGDSKEDKARAQVCDARDDISSQVQKLSDLEITTATTSQVQDGLTAIRDDLKKIGAARGDLDDERRAAVEKANQEFGSKVRATLGTLGSTTSIADAKSQLQQAFDGLASAYKDTFAKIDCG